MMPLGAMTLEKASLSSPSSMTTGLIFSEASGGGGEPRRFLLASALGKRTARKGHRAMGSDHITRAVKNCAQDMMKW